MKLQLAVPLIGGLIACSSGNNTNNNDGGPPDGGGPPPPGVTVLDATAMDPMLYLAMAVGPNNRVGVAYFRGINSSDFEIRYVEWQNGMVAASQKLPPPGSSTGNAMQRVVGLSLAFQNNGQPAVAYLGGRDDGTMSPYWFQSDAAISFRQADGASWVEDIAARMSADGVLCGNPVSDSTLGFVVGLFPALQFLGNTAYLAYRDVHTGQFPQQDWNGSDLKLAWGTAGNWSRRPVVCGGDDKKAYGGHTQMIIGRQGELAMVSDEIYDSADGTGTNVLFHRRNPDGTWTSTPWFSPVMQIANTQRGPSLAYESVLGYGVAVVDRTNNTLYFNSSPDGFSSWTQPDPVYQSGTGGWYPSVAIDPSAHEPTIAFYVCSQRAGVAEDSCPASERQLRVAYRVLGNWRQTVIDPHGGVLPKLAYLSNGKRVIAYRDPGNGSVKLYVDP